VKNWRGDCSTHPANLEPDKEINAEVRQKEHGSYLKQKSFNIATEEHFSEDGTLPILMPLFMSNCRWLGTSHIIFCMATNLLRILDRCGGNF